MHGVGPLRFRLSLAIGAVLSMLALEVSPAAGDEPPPGPAGWLFDPGAVVEIDLELPQASIEVLEVEPEEEYQPATFSLTAGGQTYGPLEVGARLKGGAGSFRPLSQKAAFKLKFDAFADSQTFFGLEKLTLNNMVQDPSMIRETLAYEAFRSAGVPASRTGYAYLRVNGEDFGLYLNIEVLDRVALPRWFSSTRHLYEGAYGVDVKPGSAAEFEVDEGKKSKREDLEALIGVANAEAGDWSEEMASVADLGEMTRMWAVERYIGHWDGYAGRDNDLVLPNNYYLHSGDTGAEAGIFRMLPWGTDQTWGDRLDFDQPAAVLFDRCLADAGCAAMYRQALVSTRSTLLALELDPRAVELAATVAPWQGMEVAPRREHGPAEVTAAVEATRAFIAGRPGELAEWLTPLPPVVTSTARAAPEPAGTPTSVGAKALRVGVPRALGGGIGTPIELSGPGSVAQRVFMQIRGRSVVVCSDREGRDRAGLLIARCDLSALARRQLEDRPLPLTIMIRFTPFEGDVELFSRRLVLPRRQQDREPRAEGLLQPVSR